MNVSPSEGTHAVLDAAPASTFLAFGGQGGPFFEELLDLHDSETVAPLIESAAAAVRQELNSVSMEHREWYPDEFRLDEWVRDPRSAPSEKQMSRSNISGVLILLTQIGHLLRFVSHSITWGELRRATAAVLGHSQGINAAFLVGRHMNTGSLVSDTFLQDFSSFVRATFWEGYRCYEAGPKHPSDDAPSPMAAVGMVPIDVVRGALEQLNARLPLEEHVYIALVNARDSVVVAGPGASVREAKAALSETLGRDSFVWEELSVSAPFHTRHMAASAERASADMKRIGLVFPGSSLQVPVFSTEDGEDLRSEDDLVPLIPELAMVRPLDWIRVADSVRSLEAVNLGLCFGPGAGVARMTASALRDSGIRVAPLNRTDHMRRFFERVRR